MAKPALGNFGSFLSHIQSPALRAVAGHWNEARGKKRMPSWTDISSPTLEPYFKMLWGFQYDAEAKEFRGWLAGNKLRKWVDGGFYGGTYKDAALLTNYDEAKRHLTRLITTPLAARSSGRLFTVGDITVTGERIALPLAADGRTGGGVLGASDYVAPPLLGPVELVHDNLEWYTI
jgi:hypothetical protein